MKGLDILGVVRGGQDTHLQVPNSDVPLPELCPQGMEIRGSPPRWLLLGLQALYDLGVGKDTVTVTLAPPP